MAGAFETECRYGKALEVGASTYGQFPPFDCGFPAILARSSRVLPNWQEWRIVQSRLNLRDLLP